MTTSVIHKDTSTVIRVSGIRDQDGAYQNNETVVLQDMVDALTGVQVTGISYPLGLVYVAASDGVYEISLPANLSVVAGKDYIATLKANVSVGGLQKVWKETVRCKYAVK